jgi:tripartite-type tricarboxylate transporter receptor subunit TctC
MKKLIVNLLLLWCFNLSATEIKMIIPYSAGGPTDRVTRTVIKHLNSDRYKFIPEYKLGAGGIVAANHVAATKKETVLMITSNAIVNAPILSPSVVNYNLEKDFIFLDYLGTEPLLLVVKSDSNINSINDFLKFSDGNQMSFGTAGVGTSGHIAATILSQNNKNHTHIPYKGSANVVLDLINGNLQWLLDSELNVGTFIESGKLKPLAVYANKRIASFPKIPTVSESGINDRQFYRWHIILANKDADKEVLKYVAKKLQDPIVKNDLVKLGLDVNKPNLQNFFSTETIKMEKISKEFIVQ